MDRQFIQDHHVVDRYLNGTLSADEEEAFEESYLSDPVVLEELELAERLKRGMFDASTGSALGHGRRNGWFGVFLSPQYAAAASLLFVASLVLAGVLYTQNVALRQRPASFDFRNAVTRLVPLVNTRSAGPIEIASPRPNELTVLEVDVALAEYDSYRATLDRTGDGASRRVLQQDGLAADSDGYLLVGMPGRLLTPGRYELLIEGRQAGWAVDRFETASEISLRIVMAE